ncbi:MAG: hypothetical protein JWP27_3029 [Flaviaesturariibacter sp.]|nr:hypothetical protein [Flaviaesturariibacter sp.]
MTTHALLPRQIHCSLPCYPVDHPGLGRDCWHPNNGPRNAGDSVISILDQPDDTAFGGLFRSIHPSEDLPYRDYKRKADSLGRIKAVRDADNRSFAPGTGYGSLGTYTIPRNEQSKQLAETAIPDSLDRAMNAALLEPDSARIANGKGALVRLNEHQGTATGTDQALYFIGVDNYRLGDDRKFFVENGAYHFAYPVWETKRVENGTTIRNGHGHKRLCPFGMQLTKKEYSFQYRKASIS